MSIDKTIEQYRGTKQAMQAIIDRHMQAAFAEIKQEFGDTPTSVDLIVESVQQISERYPHGVYCSSEVGLGGE
jgi:hypothetical protein